MRLRLCFMTLVLAVPLARAQVLDCDIGGESVSPNNGSTTAGKTGLMRCVDRSTRELRREEALRDGKFVGIKRWHEGGQLRREHSVNEQGNRDGRSREWNAAGTLVLEENYANSSNVGLQRRWDDDGKLRSVAHWGDGGGERRNEALSRMAFNRDGQLTELRCGPVPRLDEEARRCGHDGPPASTDLFSERGVREARVTHAKGQLLRHETFWDDGKTRSLDETEGPRRVSRQFARDGTKRKETLRQDGKRVLEQDFSERGTPVAEKRWTADGWLEREAEWYLNGQPRRVVAYEGASKERGFAAYVEQRFHDNGQLASQGRWDLASRRGGTPVGAHQSFDETGRLRFETTFDDKGRTTREREWDNSGKPLRDDEVYEDGSRKAVQR